VADLCKLCNSRRPRRYCSGVEGDICAVCCGTEREVSVTCPFDCDYLREARRHDKGVEHAMLHPKVEITESFMARNEILLLICTQLWWRAAETRTGVLDSDLREALAAAVKTRQTEASSGLIINARPDNAIAAAVQQNFEEKFAEWRGEIDERAAAEGLTHAMVREGDVLKMLIFLERLAASQNNGRPRCRAFYDTLRGWNDRVTQPPAPASNEA
jgi:hypothetical protein